MSIRYFGRVLLTGMLAASAANALAQGQTGWKVGVASVDVTPRESIWMAGFASRTKPSESVASDLHVKALALQDQTGKTSVIVTSDLVALRRALTDVIAERCQKKYGLPRERLLMNASHNHSGPDLSLEGGTTPRQQQTQEYTKDLLDKIVDVVGKSIESLAPATLQFDQGLAGIGVNRRRSRPNTRQLPGPVDQDVPVLAARAPDGKLRAILFGYACHVTTMAGYAISADYAGFAQTEVERLYPGAVAMFIQGAGADTNPLPRYHFEDPELMQRSLELAKLYGKVLGASVDLVIRGKMAPVTGPINAAFQYVDVPFEPLPPRQELEARSKSADENRKAQAERLLRALDAGTKIPDRYPYGIQVYYFGSGLKLIALTGEVVVDYALRLKAAYGWDDTWIAGYSNDVPGYIPSKRVLLEGGYETSGAAGGAFSAALEETIVEKVDAVLRLTKPADLR
jgi:hypothetical protein